MNRNSILILTSLLCLTMLIGGCGSAGRDLMSGIQRTENTSQETGQSTELAKSLSTFSLRISQHSASASSSGNMLLSPLSAYFALAMVRNGANGATADEMSKTLGMENLTRNDLNAGIRMWLTSLSDSEGKAKLSIANSIWYDEGFSAKQDFLQTNADHFLADIRTLDFSIASAPDVLNGWVKDKTDGKIESIVDEIGPDVVMYLINTVWFKADWADPFKSGSTLPAVFHSPSGDIQVPSMHKTALMTSLQGSFGDGILLPYTDPRFVFAAILPADGKTPRDLLASMQADDLAVWMAAGTEEQISLQIPKFETEFETELSPVLKEMGMPTAFDAQSADFKAMGSSPHGNVFISAVKQKTYCRVDEKGTEAAAATSVEMSTTSMPVNQKELVFDKPFLYGIIDVETGVPLFLGLMEDPG